jgi:CRISPR-associated endonuclease/helicase Cas3
MSAGLSPEDFFAFFHSIHGYDPFPWQAKLLHQIVDESWPSALDIPTGAGKTAALDVAIFHLALDAAEAAKRGDAKLRRAPVRILFVVDRRLVVDDAFTRASKIAAALASPSSDVVRRVARALATLAEREETPLRVVRLRGGIPREPDWVRTPLQPTIVVSTVDQVGSRLFFRGYGVSDRMKPVHAGLLGCDSLLLLDEAHLSQPFMQTFDAALRLDGAAFLRRSTLVSMSATQRNCSPSLLSEDDLTHPVLGPRLGATKMAYLEAVPHTSSSKEFCHALVERAIDLASAEHVKVVAVVVNRVQRARSVFEALRARAIGEVVLLTGRTRELDREAVLLDLLPKIRADRKGQPAEPVFVVATQCVEAGADLDFDALVTEIAPLDALRQRFGRLNRMGRSFDARAYILAPREVSAKKPFEDAVYGLALARTWHLLVNRAERSNGGVQELPHVDLGIRATESWLPVGDELQQYVSSPATAPILLPAHLNLWTHTAPVPAVDPQVSLYLHGVDSAPTDVRVVWRADLEMDDRAFALLDACPPSSLEALALPFVVALQWIRGASEVLDVADIEGAAAAASSGRAPASVNVKAVRWTETGAVRLENSDQLRPGDTLVVHSDLGGCDRFGWSPASTTAVADQGRAANLLQRGRDVFRLSPVSSDRSMVEADNHSVMSTWAARAAFADLRGVRVVRSDDGVPIALERAALRAELSGRGEPLGDASTETDAGSVGRVSVPLSDHSRGVEQYAQRFAVGLPSALAADLATAAYLHDAGKAWGSFRLWLHGGDELAAEFGAPLAKSAMRLDRRTRARVGLPEGARHELASLRFAMAHPRLASATDKELVLWLIGTHHGYGRPFFPSVAWPPEDETCSVDLGDGEVAARPGQPFHQVSSGWADMFHRLRARYGTWGLAHLEATLRLADHRRSEREQEVHAASEGVEHVGA